FFFFQAEDGIRDGHVTGVQTCALPICCDIPVRPAFAALSRGRTDRSVRTHPPARSGGATVASVWLLRFSPSATKPEAFTSSTKRSEERRVGKECRCRW